jgi:hypothetical protein
MPSDTSQRQLLVNLGNRWAVFGPNQSLANASITFGPKDGISLPRVANESEHAERRIVKIVKVAGADVARNEQRGDADFQMEFPRRLANDCRTKGERSRSTTA